PRDAAAVRHDVSTMRARMRGELDRSSDSRFDLKQGDGGLVDLEFLLQAMVLQHAARVPALLPRTRTPELLDALRDCAALDPATAADLQQAHAQLLGRALDCSLDGRPRLVPHDADIDAARAAIRAARRAA